jgi:uncharacterized protein (TIGR03083 family)
MARLAPAEYLEAVDAQSDRLVQAAERAGLDAPVPSCPEWDVAELLGHMGRVYGWARACVEANQLVSPTELAAPPPPGERAAWVRDQAARIVGALDRPADDPAWTWAPSGQVGFWQRRQAHETVVHRVDAELAAGAPTPVPDRLAVDGIDEFLELLPNRFGVPPIAGHGETMHLHCTDQDGEWLARLTDQGLEVERTHAKGDVAVRGAASDLFLVMTGRLAPERVEVLGDRAVLDGFLSQANF